MLVASLMALTAGLRLPNLPTRGTWGPEQGAIMENLRSMFETGIPPLVGLPTGEGGLHHGALYFYLLTPAALPSQGLDPIAVAWETALIGVLAVLATWWVAHGVAGPVGGILGALVAAASVTGVVYSSTIDNPNVVPLFAALAVGAAWRAWSREEPRWWLLAAVGQGIAQQLHILAIVGAVPLAVLFLLDVRRRKGQWRQMLRIGTGSLLIVAAGYVPMLIHELATGFSDLSAAASAGAGTYPISLTREVLGLPARSVAYWLGLTGEQATWSVIAVGVAAAILLGAAISSAFLGPRTRRPPARWIVLVLLASTTSLALILRIKGNYLPSVAEWYLAPLGPVVFALLGIGAGVLWEKGQLGRTLAVALIGVLVAWNIAHEPPSVAYDGGWPAAAAAGARVVATTRGDPVFFTDSSRAPLDYYSYPFRVAGGNLSTAPSSRWVVVTCFDAWRSATGVMTPCGPDGDAAHLAADPTLSGLSAVDSFVPAYGRTIGIYRRQD